MANKYIYISYGNSKENINLFSDFEQLDNVQCIKTKKKHIKNIFLKVIRKIHLSKKINKIIKLPMRWIWYDLKEIQLNADDNYIIMMLPSVFFDYDMNVINKIAKHKNVKLVLILLDTVGVNTPVGRIIDDIYKDKVWSYIFSYDKNDAEKYGFIYLNECYYSKPNIEELKNNNEKYSDAYFIGSLKPGRKDEIIKLFGKLKKSDVLAEFDVAENDGNTLQYSNNGFNILKQRKQYIEVIEKVQNTNCIVEFLQQNQNAQSLRYFEAVCFNKKLLTNNENVKRLHFYNDKYMKIFKNIEDIDTEWVKSKEKVDYKYNNEFSPINIIKEIEVLERK